MSLNRSWSRQAILALINVYERNPCLYDSKSPDYRNKKMNRTIMEEMVHAVAQFHPQVTAEDCKKKYQCLRNQFLAECRKLKDSKKSKAGTSNVYTPKLWCYEALLFLRDYVKVRPGVFVSSERRSSVPFAIAECKRERKERKNSDATRSSNCSRSSEEIKESTPTGRGSPDDSTAIASTLHKIAEKSKLKDDYDIFGNFVASRLRKLGKNYSDDLEHEIINLIFSAERQKKYDS